MANGLKLPQDQWYYYHSCVLACLRDLDTRRDAEPTSALARHFLHDAVKTRQVLREMLRRNLVFKSEPVYNLHLWRITDKGREYLSEQLIKA